MGWFGARDDFNVRVVDTKQAGKTHFCELRVTGPDFRDFTVTGAGSDGVAALKHATAAARKKVTKIRKDQAKKRGNSK